MAVHPDKIYSRNIERAGSITYELNRVHSKSVVNHLEQIAMHLMIDSQSLSVALRVASAFHEDCGQILISNVKERSKQIGDFTLLITNMGMSNFARVKHRTQLSLDKCISGTGKSVIFSHIMKIFHLKRSFDQIRRTRENVESADLWTSNGNYRHAILNEVKCVIIMWMSVRFIV